MYLLLFILRDTTNRRRALILSVLLMLVPSFLVGCLPTYRDIQGGATFLLVLLRICQGLAAGGEFGTAIVYTMEISNQGSKGILRAIFQSVIS